MNSNTDGLSAEELDALEKVALAATQGTWVLVSDAVTGERWVQTAEQSWVVVQRMGHLSDYRENARHIATFDPPTVLRLIAAARSEAPRDGVAGGSDREALVTAVGEAVDYLDWAGAERAVDAILALISPGSIGGASRASPSAHGAPQSSAPETEATCDLDLVKLRGMLEIAARAARDPRSVGETQHAADMARLNAIGLDLHWAAASLANVPSPSKPEGGR